MHCFRFFIPLVLLAITLVWSATPASAVQLSADGEAQMPIVLGPALSDEPVATEVGSSYGRAEFDEVPSSKLIRDAAEALAGYLEQMSGASFEITTGDGQSGIAVGLFSDFPELKLDGQFDPDDIFRTEEYLIRSHDDGLYVIGATELAVRHAVWDLLYRLGHRQFFPGETWEIVPQQAELAIDVDAFESPDYHSRLIWYGTGFLDYNEQPYEQWTARNRAVAGFRLNTSHEYNRIRKRNREAFAQNPDFYAMVDGERKARSHAKFNIANPELRELVLQDAIQWFEDEPHHVSKSMDPSDMGGWSESEASKAIGTPTDQALTLANHVVKGVNAHFDEEKFVGMYAYYQHQAAPNIRVHPNVIVSFATRFLRTRKTVDELVRGWRAQGSRYIGIREYYSVNQWDWDIPALSMHGGDISYLQHSIPRFHRMGARFLTAESSDNWGPNGLGYYLASRMLWDVDEADRVDELVDDFLDKAFGPAREPMADFYELINGRKRPLLRDNMIGRLYELLDEASTLAANAPDVRERLDDLILYVHYLERFRTYEIADGEARQEAFGALIRHAYRMRETSLVHIKPLYERNRLGKRDPQVDIPDEADWDVPESENPWKDSTPFTRQELDTILAEGMSTYGSEAYELPTMRLSQPMSPGTDAPNSPRIRYNATYLVHAEAGDRVRLDVTCQLLDFTFAPRYVVVSPSGEIVVEGQTRMRKQIRRTFVASESGTYRVAIGTTPNTLKFQASHPWAILARDHLGLPRLALKRPVTQLYFLVPAGVERFEIEVSGQGAGELVDGALLDADGEQVAQQADISGDEPARFVGERTDASQAEVWSVTLDKPADAYFGDASIALDEQLPPALATDPAFVFEVE